MEVSILGRDMSSKSYSSHMRFHCCACIAEKLNEVMLRLRMMLFDLGCLKGRIGVRELTFQWVQHLRKAMGDPRKRTIFNLCVTIITTGTMTDHRKLKGAGMQNNE